MGRHPGRDIVVVAASAGGLIPLRRFLSLLPADLPASILVVLHIQATGGRALPRILDRSGPLAASVPADGEKLAHGRVFVAPLTGTCSWSTVPCGFRAVHGRTGCGPPRTRCSAARPATAGRGLWPWC